MSIKLITLKHFPFVNYISKIFEVKKKNLNLEEESHINISPSKTMNIT